MRISDWSSDVCSSDLASPALGPGEAAVRPGLLAPLHLEGAVRDPDDAGHLDGDTALTDHLEGVVAAGELVEPPRPAVRGVVIGLEPVLPHHARIVGERQHVPDPARQGRVTLRTFGTVAPHHRPPPLGTP